MMPTYRSSPSFGKVALRIVLIVALVASSYELYSTLHQTNPIQHRLHALGYPQQGYILTGNEILFSNGHMAIVQGDYVQDYPITAEQAYEIANNYLASFNQKISKYNMKIYVKASSLTEKEKNGQYYWIYSVYVKTGHDSLFAGFIWVNRVDGTCTMKGLLG